MVFRKIVFRNILTSTCARVSKDTFLGKNEIFYSQQTEII